LLEKFPLFLMSAASAAATMLAQRSSIAVETSLPLGMRLKNAAVCLVEYILKMLWPAKLSVFYPHPEYALPRWQVVAAVAILGTITALVFHFRQRQYLVTGWLIFVTALLPVIGIVQAGRQAMADRYAYIPLIGLFILVVWELANVTESLAISPRVRAFAAAGLLLALAATTSRTLQYWQDGVTLFTHARLVASRPDYVIEQQLGYALDAAGRSQEAMKHHMAALELNPRDAITHYNVATELLRQGEPRAAIKEFQLAMIFAAGKEVTVSCSNNTGVAYLALNEYDAAEKNFTAALSLDPNHYSSLLGRGQVFYQQARFGAAASDFGRAARINPDAAVLLWLGKSLESSGKMEAAVAAYQDALRRNPGLTEARSRIDSAREQPARPGLRYGDAGQQR